MGRPDDGDFPLHKEMDALTTAEFDALLAEKQLKSVAPLPMIGGLVLVFAGSLHLPTRPTRWAWCALSILLAAIMVFVLDLLVGVAGALVRRHQRAT
ncbi:hypothetical protein ABN028_26915 [Actinopolymorpha sp. B17G11]|uniref:hypothetical protein n=1 Tax=Actinopolymorpha sp. B17G11 TaxID=3160861 RepID=UPI0032E4A8E0